MTTPKHVYYDIARRYSAEKITEEIVNYVFEQVIPKLPVNERRYIFDEVLGRVSEPELVVNKEHISLNGVVFEKLYEKCKKYDFPEVFDEKNAYIIEELLKELRDLAEENSISKEDQNG